MEMFLVNLYTGLKFVFSLALLFGWILAWVFKSKGGGYLLWKIYCICFVIAALMFFLINQFSLGNGPLEWFMSDTGLIAALNGGRGLSFASAEYLTTFNSVPTVGILYCIITYYVWKSRLKKNLSFNSVADQKEEKELDEYEPFSKK
jgi:hypothetical protein